MEFFILIILIIGLFLLSFVIQKITGVRLIHTNRGFSYKKVGNKFSAKYRSFNGISESYSFRLPHNKPVIVKYRIKMEKGSIKLRIGKWFSRHKNAFFVKEFTESEQGELEIVPPCSNCGLSLEGSNTTGEIVIEFIHRE